MVSTDCQRELQNAVASVRASFRALDASGSKLDRQHARTKERFLTQILGAHHERRLHNAPSSANGRMARAAAREDETVILCGVANRAGDDAANRGGDDDTVSLSSGSSLSATEYENLMRDVMQPDRQRPSSATSVVGVKRRTMMRPTMTANSTTGTVASSRSRWSRISIGSGCDGAHRPTIEMRDRLRSSIVHEGDEGEEASRHLSEDDNTAPHINTPRVQVRVSANRPFSAPKAYRWSERVQPRVQAPSAGRSPPARADVTYARPSSSGSAASEVPLAVRRPEAPSTKTTSADARNALRPASAFGRPRRPRMRCTQGTAPMMSPRAQASVVLVPMPGSPVKSGHRSSNAG